MMNVWIKLLFGLPMINLLIFLSLLFIVSMSSNWIEQQCQKIIKDPSKINNLNEILKKSFEISDSQEQMNSFAIILSLIANWLNGYEQVETQIARFIDSKLSVIAEYLINQNFDESQEESLDKSSEALHLFIRSFHLATDKDTIIEYFNSIFIKRTNSFIKQICLNLTDLQFVKQICKNISKFVSTANADQLQNIVDFILNLPAFSQFQFVKERNSIKISEEESKSQFKLEFQRLVLKILQNEQVPRQSIVELYRKLGEKILSKFHNPLILSQYFLDKFKQNAQIQVQILSCLFILVGKYGLEFEQFYPKLQVLITKKSNGLSVYQLPNSRRFFKLIQSALRSSKVPHSVILKFGQIIISQIFTQKSEFAYWALSFFVNLVKKHRKLLDHLSQIPEVELLKKHYSLKVRSLVAQLFKDLNKAEYLDIEQFAKVNCAKLTRNKIQDVISHMNEGDQTEFKVISIYEPI